MMQKMHVIAPDWELPRVEDAAVGNGPNVIINEMSTLQIGSTSPHLEDIEREFFGESIDSEMLKKYENMKLQYGKNDFDSLLDSYDSNLNLRAELNIGESHTLNNVEETGQRNKPIWDDYESKYGKFARDLLLSIKQGYVVSDNLYISDQAWKQSWRLSKYEFRIPIFADINRELIAFARKLKQSQEGFEDLLMKLESSLKQAIEIQKSNQDMGINRTAYIERGIWGNQKSSSSGSILSKSTVFSAASTLKNFKPFLKKKLKSKLMPRKKRGAIARLTEKTAANSAEVEEHELGQRTAGAEEQNYKANAYIELLSQVAYRIVEIEEILSSANIRPENLQASTLGKLNMIYHDLIMVFVIEDISELVHFQLDKELIEMLR
ncbi:hypothetical protein CANCADRAFT_109848 [Tortispora caseinolytica NRRL Y-17796]|uniref:Uncharacterized protein n=1 Tax=Tortispora caseinolytica NRRL Y-17796 TaxID=767744 RepID=A0A1E4TG17_9ASCO|nr:hypothetical protein CANCADRAFT_109848 [Tortispora caseinolytica NRRL Y-17796]